MPDPSKHKIEILEDGFTIINNIYQADDIAHILAAIEAVDQSKENFRKSAGLFAVRQFLREVPQAVKSIFNHNLKGIIPKLFGDNYFVVKSIYFDKPESSNWFVPYHQDLTISVDKKLELEGFGSWTVKQNQFAVQPPPEILQGIFTVRIHLDDADENNGALRVIPKSHTKGIRHFEAIDKAIETEAVCKVQKGGILIMKPLLFHSSGRATSNKKRWVIHIEFANRELPPELLWAERMNFSQTKACN